MDFSQWYIYACAFHGGSDLYRTDLNQLATRLHMSLSGYDRANYPPTFILLLEPLSLLSPVHGYWIWTLFNLFLLARILQMLLGLEPGCSIWARLSIGFLMVLYFPVWEHFHFAQVQLLILYLLMSAMRSSRAGNHLRAGAVLGFACLLKVYPLVMLGYWIVKKQWRTLRYAIMSISFGAIVTLVLFGESNASAFVSRLGFLGGLIGPLSVTGMVSHTFKFLLPAGPNVVLSALCRICEAIAQLAVLCVAVYGTMIASHDRRGDERSFGLWLVATVLLTPTAWDHYMVLFLPVLVQLFIAAYMRAAPRIALWCGAAAYLWANAVGLAEVHFDQFMLLLGSVQLTACGAD